MNNNIQILIFISLLFTFVYSVEYKGTIKEKFPLSTKALKENNYSKDFTLRLKSSRPECPISLMGKIIEDTHKNSEAKREDTILAKDVNKNKGKNVELTITCHGIKVKCEINEEKLFSGNLCEIGVMLFSKEEKKVYFHINDVDGYELDYSEGIGSSTSGGKH